MSSYTQAASGTTGNVEDFPGVYSGAGTKGDAGPAGAGASGGGASGGGGSYGGGNDAYNDSGGGGGGAGGCDDAGGGKGGPQKYFPGKDAYNHHTTPTPTKDHLGNEVTSGYGVGGTTNTNGTDGWLYIKRIS